MAWAKLKYLVDDGCIACNACSTLTSLLDGQELALLEPIQVRVCRKKRNSPLDKILTEHVNWALKIQKHSVKAKNTCKFCSETCHLKMKRENGSLVLTLQNYQHLSDPVTHQEEPDCDLPCARKASRFMRYIRTLILHPASQLNVAWPNNAPQCLLV